MGSPSPFTSKESDSRPPGDSMFWAKASRPKRQSSSRIRTFNLITSFVPSNFSIVGQFGDLRRRQVRRLARALRPALSLFEPVVPELLEEGRGRGQHEERDERGAPVAEDDVKGDDDEHQLPDDSDAAVGQVARGFT